MAMFGGLMQMMAPMMLGMSVGSMVGHLSRRSFGQYDLPIPRPASPEVHVVSATIDAFSDAWSLPVDDLRLWVSLQEIASHDPALLDGVRFEFIGVRDPNSLRGADVSLLPPGVLSLHDRVSYEESVSLMRSSDGLLVLDGAWPGKGIFFPSKLADYIGAGRPIMGIASPGAGAGIIERLGGVVAEVGDPAAIALGLRRFLAMVRTGCDDRAGAWGNPGERSQYAAPAVAAQFREQLGRAMAARGHPLGRVGVGVLSSALT